MAISVSTCRGPEVFFDDYDETLVHYFTNMCIYKHTHTHIYKVKQNIKSSENKEQKKTSVDDWRVKCENLQWCEWEKVVIGAGGWMTIKLYYTHTTGKKRYWKICECIYVDTNTEQKQK